MWSGFFRSLSFVDPKHGNCFIHIHAKPISVTLTERFLGAGQSLFGGLSVPDYCFGFLLFHSIAIEVAVTKELFCVC